MVHPARAAFEARLETVRILSEIVQKAGDIPPLTRAELGRTLAREVGDLEQVLTQRLPVGAVGPAGGMGEIARMIGHFYQPILTMRGQYSP
jgi:hypothetical protein